MVLLSGMAATCFIGWWNTVMRDHSPGFGGRLLGPGGFRLTVNTLRGEVRLVRWLGFDEQAYLLLGPYCVLPPREASIGTEVGERPVIFWSNFERGEVSI